MTMTVSEQIRVIRKATEDACRSRESAVLFLESAGIIKNISMKTPLQELLERFKKPGWYSTDEIEQEILELLAIERGCIQSAYKQGQIDIATDLLEDFNRMFGTNHKMPTHDGADAEKYFNKTYNYDTGI